MHLWDPTRLHYGWLEGAGSLNKPFLLKEYKEASREADVEKMVFVQAESVPEDFMKEAQWVSSLSREDAGIQGIVAGASLEKGDKIKPFLEELAADKLVKGVRRLIESEEDIEFCLRADFVEGVRILEDYNFSFDIAAKHRHAKNVIKLVKQCPNVRFVLDHIGKPDIKNHLMEPWEEDLQTLAELPNIMCKISGLVNEADIHNWTREDLRPYIDHAIDYFGFERVMYGGDWPVCTLATEYQKWVDTLKWAVADCSETERKKLFRDNAIDFYRLSC